MILGIDEVGRGCWAGPLVVGAVVLGGVEVDGLTDSKKLTKKRRQELDIEIREKAEACSLGWVEATELDEIGLSEALRVATRRAVEQIKTSYHEIIIDGTSNFLAGTSKGDYVTVLPKADLLVPSVSAASVIAKVARDNYMAEQDASYPGYGFKSHVGYGVARHRAAIESQGVTPLHRLSFLPLRKYRQAEPKGVTPVAQEPTARSIGDASETAAANFLVRQGHTIIDRNWKTRWCEIDIVSLYKHELYFTEVKHRTRDDGGDGLAAITSKKLKQMCFAAELYLANHPAQTARLLAVSTTGESPLVVDCLEIV